MIKSIEQVKERQRFGEVMTMMQFLEMAADGALIRYDGMGHPHDGESERTDLDIWSVRVEDLYRFPYVCWYNK